MKLKTLRLVGAIVIGMVAAFIAGIMFAGRDAGRQMGRPVNATASDGRAKAEFRKFYSPKISSDPYVLDQQRRVVEALELQCRHFRENCREAQQARQWMNKQDNQN